MELELLSSEGDRNTGRSSNRRMTIAKEWAKCFRTVYYQQTDGIEFKNEEDEQKIMSE
jgi:hypothetical protein